MPPTLQPILDLATCANISLTQRAKNHGDYNRNIHALSIGIKINDLERPLTWVSRRENKVRSYKQRQIAN